MAVLDLAEAIERDNVLLSANFTDPGNAERLASLHGHKLRYAHDTEEWLIWDGKTWAPDPRPAVVGLMIETMRMTGEQASRLPYDDDQRDRLVKYARRSENDKSLKPAISIARSLPGIATLRSTPSIVCAAAGIASPL